MNVDIIKVFSGDDEPIPLEFRSPNEQVVDISGFTDIQFTVKDRRGRILISKSYVGGTILFTTDGTDGRADIYILSQDTHSLDGEYDYDIQIIKDSRRNTIVRSFFLVSRDINEG